MASMSESLECSVCLSTYNLSDRRPKALGCLYTICEQCVDQLTKGSHISCPTCRQQFPSNQVAVNFALTDVLQAICEKCIRMPHEIECPHCSKNLCGTCLESHPASFRDEVIMDLKKLDCLIQQATDFVKDGSFFKHEKEKETDTVNDIRKAIQSHRDELDRLEKQLKKDVRLTKERNLASYKQQSNILTEKIDAMKGFPAKNMKKLKEKSKSPLSKLEMVSVHQKCKSLIDELTFDSFIFDNYSFGKAAFNPLSVGTLVTHRVNRKALTDTGGSTPYVPDYKTLRYNGHTGSHGSEQMHFNTPCHVLCTSDRIIVSDTHNHRLKIYDNDLNLQRVVGVKGSGRGQFCNPCGLATGPGGELYLADYNNHRVVVMTSQGEYLREICRKGSGDDELQHPLGIAISDGDLYIVDRYNHRIKVVKTDDSFVRHIGSKGDGPGQYKKHHLRVFSRTGEYQGLFPPTIPTELATAIPNGMTIDRSDNVLVTYNTNQLAVYNSQGDLITVLGSKGQGPGQFNVPTGVSVNAQRGHVVVCDKDNHRIQMFKFNSK